MVLTPLGLWFIGWVKPIGARSIGWRFPIDPIRQSNCPDERAVLNFVFLKQHRQSAHSEFRAHHTQAVTKSGLGVVKNRLSSGYRVVKKRLGFGKGGYEQADQSFIRVRRVSVECD
jgi:hypothetical protein